MLADGATGSPSADVGLLFNRGNQGNAAIFYDESAKTFKLSDTKDPKSNTSLSPVTASNLDVGILTASTVKFDGADLNTAISDNVSTLNTSITALETRRTNNIAGAISTVELRLTLQRQERSFQAVQAHLAVSDVTATELGHLDGVTSAIQTQLDAKAALAGATFTGDVTFTGDGHNVVFDKSDNALKFADDAKAIFGAGGHLEIFHNGSSSFIKDLGQGNLLVDASGIYLRNENGLALLAVTGGVELKHGTSFTETKLTTKSTGVTVTGEVEAGSLDISGDVDVDGTLETDALSINGTAVTATATELNLLDGVTATTAELNHVDGVTSAIQTQLDAKSTTSNATALAAEDVALQARITANNTLTSAVETRRTQNIAGAVSTITTSDLTASRAMVTNGSGKVAVSAVTATELGYLDGVSSAIQTQLDAKQATITGAATTIDDADLTASRALVSSGSGKVAVSAVTSTELGYLDGVTSAIQTQLDAKLASAGANNFTDNVTITSTSAGAENNPEFALVRNSSSPADNDLLGTFVFKGKNDAAEETVYASFQTRANDVSDGTEDGNMFFKVMTNGTLEDRLALKGANPTLFSTQPVRLNSVDLQFRASSKTTTVTPGSPSGDITITLPSTTRHFSYYYND